MDNHGRLSCTSCGEPRYINSAPTANGIIINNKKQLLLTKRGVEPAIGTWDFAGGFLENGEDPKAGLKREIREELAVECEIGDFFDMHVCCFPEYYRECMLNMYFFVTIGKGTISPHDDVVDIKWYGFEQIKPELMPYFGAWEVVEKLRFNGFL